MVDKEKVIKGLELCVTDYLTQDNCKICPYGNGNDTGYCWVEMNTDALELLKEQELKTGYWNGPECSCCHTILERTPRFFRYCPYCGAKMDNTEGR